MVPGGKPLIVLELLRARYPIVMHGVSMSIASTAPLDFTYLTALRDLSRRIEPCWISDHLCWTGVHGVNLHDLLPIPYTAEALQHVCERIDRVQEFLGRPLTLENVSSYASFRQSEMQEWEFLAELTRRTGCWLLLDVNNIYVNAVNHGIDAMTFLHGIPREPVVQLHLAGHSDLGTYVVDTHDAPVCGDVWQLYAEALRRFGFVSTMIERDDKIPPLDEMVLEVDHARSIAARILGTDALQLPEAAE